MIIGILARVTWLSSSERKRQKLGQNGAGRFSLSSTVKEEGEGQESGEIALVRELSLASSEYAPEAWPELRALLLADAYERSRLLLLK